MNVKLGWLAVIGGALFLGLWLLINTPYAIDVVSVYGSEAGYFLAGYATPIILCSVCIVFGVRKIKSAEKYEQVDA